MFRKPVRSNDAPRYCPDCKTEVSRVGASSLCDECGSTLVVEGYCPVCESYLLLPCEAVCPKHDVVLEPGPADRAEPDLIGESASWSTVQVFPDTLMASLARTRLEAEGIRTFIDGERLPYPGLYHVAGGGIKLQVPETQAAAARIILAQDWSLPGDERDDFEDLL